MLTAFCCSSQISLLPDGSGRFCTDTSGVREIAKLFKELEYTRQEIDIFSQVLEASEREADSYQKLLRKTDSINEHLNLQNQDLNSENQSLKRERWYFAGGGGLIVLVLCLL